MARPELERFLEHEAGLRHGAVFGIDEQKHTVHHLEDALDFAAEIGVAGSVDDIDRDALIGHRRAFGEDRDAALALDRIGIEDRFLGRIRLDFEFAGLRSRASTSVVFPWSTWAMMAILRMF